MSIYVYDVLKKIIEMCYNKISLHGHLYIDKVGLRIFSWYPIIFKLIQTNISTFRALLEYFLTIPVCTGLARQLQDDDNLDLQLKRDAFRHLSLRWLATELIQNGISKARQLTKAFSTTDCIVGVGSKVMI